jgi:hypothetical protein
MRAAIVVFALVTTGACKFDALPKLNGGDDAGGGDDGGGSGSDACTGIACNVAQCTPGQETTLSGRVLLPNGTTPMANVDVYVPNSEPGPIVTGASCVPCGPLPGDPVTRTRTAADGTFSLKNVPSGDDIPVVVTIGKWRRKARIAHVDSCTSAAIPDELTRLPKNRAEGDMPKIAVSTGSADALECIVRKIGVDDAEFGTAGDPQAVHLYTDTGNGQGSKHNGINNEEFAESTTLWSSPSSLMRYDAVLLSCEGNLYPTSKPLTSMMAMKQYADSGGRIFASHFSYVWVEGASAAQAPPVWPNLATFSTTSGPTPTTEILVDTATAAGMELAAFETAVAGTQPGHIPIAANSGRSTIMGIDDGANAKRLAYFVSSAQIPQMFTFDTPVESSVNLRCGRVVVSDLHQGSGSMSSPTQNFPIGCTATPMSPQDLAVAYMILQMQRCVDAGP